MEPILGYFGFCPTQGEEVVEPVVVVVPQGQKDIRRWFK